MTTRRAWCGLIRFKARLGYAIDERTRAHYENAREAEMLSKITTEALGAELRKMADEPNIGDLMEGLEQENCWTCILAPLSGPKTQSAYFQKLQKARQMAPVGRGIPDSSPAAVSECTL